VRLLGARLVSSVEVRKGAKFDEAVIKAVTGDDAITAAAKYESEITFYATFALWLAGNDAPAIRDDDEGAWSRVRRVPFTNPLPKARQDPTMREKLRAPEVLSAVLAWAVQGCIDWQRRGIGTCAAVEQSSAAYRAEMDRVAGFFAERCRFGTYEKVACGELRKAYEAWAQEQGIKHALSGNDFGARLRDRGIAHGKSNGARVWKGIRLLAEDEEPEQGHRFRESLPRT
jgi:putative DNA primase/helicase